MRGIGYTVRFLPPYSPGLNAIELAFSKLKRLLRSTGKRMIPELVDYLKSRFAAFVADECRNYFRHDGYAIPPPLHRNRIETDTEFDSETERASESRCPDFLMKAYAQLTNLGFEWTQIFDGRPDRRKPSRTASSSLRNARFRDRLTSLSLRWPRSLGGPVRPASSDRPIGPGDLSVSARPLPSRKSAARVLRMVFDCPPR